MARSNQRNVAEGLGSGTARPSGDFRKWVMAIGGGIGESGGFGKGGFCWGFEGFWGNRG